MERHPWRRGFGVLLASLVLALVQGIGYGPWVSGATPFELTNNMISVARTALPEPGEALRTGQTTEGTGDLAFWGKYAVANRGLSDHDDKNDGFVLFDISNPAQPRLVSRFRCAQAGLDISIWEDLVILSQQNPTFHPADKCANDVPGDPKTDPAFAGLRIVSIKNPTEPRLIASVRTNDCKSPKDCPASSGSHTHTLVPDPLNRQLFVYANGSPESVVTVDLNDPTHPDVETYAAETSPGIAGCHDLQVHMPSRIAACAAIGDIELWDLQTLNKPTVISRFHHPGIQEHHSAVFSPDGQTLAISDETLVESAVVFRPAGDGCQPEHARPGTAGALRFYDISHTLADYRQDKPLPTPPIPAGDFQPPIDFPHDQVAAPCYGHYASIVPIPADTAGPVKNVLSIGWQGGGTWLIDFSEPSTPREIGHFLDLGSSPSMVYAAYWYNGFVYANNGNFHPYPADTDRGFEVLQPQLSNDAGEKADRQALDSASHVTHLNPQTQE